MSKRYVRLFSLPENLGLEDCPIVISAGALLKDTATEKILAQLKLRNLSPRKVTAVQIKINAYDPAGVELGGVDTFSYHGLNIPIDGEFGTQTPIYLPDAATRSFTVDILSVTFADGSIYQPTGSRTTQSATAGMSEQINELNSERKKMSEREQMLAEEEEHENRELLHFSLRLLVLVIIAVTIVIAIILGDS